MATVIYSADFTKHAWYRQDAVAPYLDDDVLVDPYPQLPDLYVNKVWDPAAVAYVRWSTYYVDTQGAEYPGPSAWGAVVGTYCVEHIIFQRLGV